MANLYRTTGGKFQPLKTGVYTDQELAEMGLLEGLRGLRGKMFKPPKPRAVKVNTSNAMIGKPRSKPAAWQKMSLAEAKRPRNMRTMRTRKAKAFRTPPVLKKLLAY